MAVNVFQEHPDHLADGDTFFDLYGIPAVLPGIVKPAIISIQAAM
jgi:hypothetical protein